MVAPKKSRPSIARGYFASLADEMAKFEQLAKVAIDHRGEKGRTVESAVENALRVALPERYSLGTGFAINAANEKSAQLDVVIYDAASNSPMMFGKGVGLFPIECIYGFVEVKSVLRKRDLSQIAKSIGKVRQMAKDKTYLEYNSRERKPGEWELVRSHKPDPLAPRSYAIAVRSSGFQSADELKDALVLCTQEHDAHIHGLAVLDNEWVLTQNIYTVPHSFKIATGDALAKFVMSVLDGIQSIPMRPAALERYLEDR